MNKQQKVIVIGGGLVGCASAYYLASEGWSVTLLERSSLGSGASYGNCGYVCPSHIMPLSGPGVIAKTLPKLFQRDAPLSIPARWDPQLWRWLLKFRNECREDRMNHAAEGRHALLRSSMELYRELVDAEKMECEWTDRGLLLVYQTKSDFEGYAKTVEHLRSRYSVRIDAYPDQAVTEFEPALKDGLAGGWHFPKDAHVRPDRLVEGFKQALGRQVVDLREQVEVTDIEVESGKVAGVRTSAGRFAADLYVVATGAEAPKFAKQLKLQLPIQPGKGYSLTYDHYASPPRVPMIFEEHHVAVTPFENGFRVGSTMEFTGYDRSLNPKRLSLLKESAVAHLKEGVPDHPTESWCGWRPMVYDGLPCIGAVPSLKNLLVAAGNGMVGLASAPATGRLIAELASGKTPHIDPDFYAPDRFRS